MIRRTDSLGNLLDLTSLEIGNEYVKLAYLHHVKEGRTEGTNSGYFRLYLKDVNGNVIIGRLFNVTGYEDKGLVILALKGKPVKVHFRVDEYNGSMSLIIHSIEYYDGVFEYASFIGKYEKANYSYDFVSNAFKKGLGEEVEIDLPIIYKTASLRSIYGGKVGAYTLLLQKVMVDLVAIKDLPEVDFKQFLKVFYMVQDVYYQYLKRVEDLDLIPLAEKIKFVNKIASKDETVETLIATEVLSALLKLGQTETLVGNLLYDYIKQAIEHFNLLCEYQTITSMGREVGGRRLVRY